MVSRTPKVVRTTKEFREWHDDLKDEVAKAIVAARIKRVQFGLYGDVKPVGEGISEIRVDHGPGYRVYFSESMGGEIVLLLVGGNKATQQRDIKRAKEIHHSLKRQQAVAGPSGQAKDKGSKR